ncbi:Prefoldin [Mrakia frigida]|uniref:prefolding complex chaperone subunit n=1 Tax=Mrakia frigida TaxID=29902 RepID=UPI003FCC1571
MSALNDQTIQRIFQQIQGQLQRSQKDLSLVRAQLAGKDREKRVLELTAKQLDQVPKEEGAKMYRGVGKMFLLQPRSTIEDAHSTASKEIADEIVNLNKKAKYLQKQFDDANGQLRDILHNQPRSE